MSQKKHDPAYERIWGDEPMGLRPIYQECKDCAFQFITPNQIFKGDYLKGYCRIYSKEKGKEKPDELLMNKAKCPHKITIKQAIMLITKLQNKL